MFLLGARPRFFWLPHQSSCSDHQCSSAAMITFSVSSPQLLLRVPPGRMFKGPAVHIAHSPELLHRQPARCVPESLPSGARTRQWVLQHCLLCGVGWMEGVRGCGQRDKKRRCGLRAGGEGAGREARRRTMMKKKDLAFIKHLPCIRPRISSKPQKQPCEKSTI